MAFDLCSALTTCDDDAGTASQHNIFHLLTYHFTFSTDSSNLDDYDDASIYSRWVSSVTSQGEHSLDEHQSINEVLASMAAWLPSLCPLLLVSTSCYNLIIFPLASPSNSAVAIELAHSPLL